MSNIYQKHDIDAVNDIFKASDTPQDTQVCSLACLLYNAIY